MKIIAWIKEWLGLCPHEWGKWEVGYYMDDTGKTKIGGQVRKCIRCGVKQSRNK